MAQVIIRNLDPKTVEALKARARRKARSLEAELRDVLTESVARDAREDFLRWVDEHRFGGVPDDRAIGEAIHGADH